MAAFTPGNIVVYRVGTGAAALGNTATQVFLDEYTPGGSLVQSIALPGTGAGVTKLTSQGSSDSEGMMSLSIDGKYLLLPGYNAEVGTATPTSATAAAAPRIVGRVGADGLVDLSTVLTDIATATRSVASATGAVIYDATSVGMRLANYGQSAASTSVVATGAERVTAIFNNQLYVSTATAISAVGTGLPTGTAPLTAITFTAGNAVTLSSIYGFFFADLNAGVSGLDTLYVADDAVGLVKFSLVGTSWTYNGIIGSTNEDYRGLTASVNGTTVTLYAARDNGAAVDTLVQIVDAGGYNAAFSSTTQTLIGTGIANTEFRGVAFVPQNAVAATETISFVSGAISQAEGDAGATTAYTITLTRTGSTAAAATVAYGVSAAAGGAALDAADFGGTLPSGTATFAINSATATITINVSGDRVIESDESFVVTLSGPSAGYQIAPNGATQTETIVNDDVVGVFAIARAGDATEGGNATFTVSRTGGLGGPIDVPYTVVAGTATAADFPGGILPTGTVRFEAGQTSVTLAIATFDDTIVEGDEQFTLRVTQTDGTFVTADGFIGANDPAGTVSIADVRVDEGAGTATITLTRTGGSGDVTVTYATADGTAIAGADYTATAGTATFFGTATATTFTIPINNDSLFEPNETFTVGLGSGVGAPAIARGTATVTIVDNDQANAPGVFAITPATQSVAEGGSGTTTPIGFTVTRTDGSFGVATIPYTITFTGPNAAAASDFAANQTFTGVVTFADGDTAPKAITLQVQGDSAIEANDTFTVTLGSPSIGSVSAASAVGTILNDDSAFAIAAGSASEAATAGVPFVVTRTGDLSQAATLSYAVSLAAGDTATAADFPGGTLPTGTVSFVAGTASARILVPVLNDTLIEANETFSVTLSAANANQTVTTATATGTIVNDDFPLLFIGDPSVVEGNGTIVLRYVVTSNVAAGAGGISFDIATADGTATAGSDYIARSVSGATIAPGQTSYTFDVTVTGDTLPERAETVFVNLTNAVNATIADAQGVGIIDNDDGAPAGLQPYFSADFTGFTAAGFTPNPTAGQLNSNVWRVAGLSDLPNPAFGGTYVASATTGDFARGVIVGAADPTSGGTYSPSANGALIVQPTGTDFENGGFFEAQIVNTTGFTATSFEVAFDWAFRNSGGRTSNLAFSYSTDGVTFTAIPAAAFSTPGAADAAVAATFSTQGELLTLSNLLVGDGNALFLRWTHTGSSGGGNRDEVGIDNVVVRAGVSDIQTLSAADITIVEGTGGTSSAVFTITRSSGIGTASVGYATADGTALAGRDYTAQSGTVTFAEGERSKTVTVAINPDTANEANETFFLNLTNAAGVTVTDAQARATIQNDDTGPVAIYDIQGAGHVSAFRGLVVTTVGIVTAVASDRYWIQDATGDGLFATSDAIQVVFGTAPSGVLVGDRVNVTGTVTELAPATGALTVTQLTAPMVMVLERGVALPAAVVIGTNGILPPTQVIDNDRLTLFDPAQDGIDFYEALEGMLVTVETPLVVGNSDGRATFIVASAGVGATGINDRGGITLSAGDDAPERIQLFADSTLLPGYVPGHTVGDVLGNITGILTYFTYPELLPTTPVTTVKDVTLVPEITTLNGDANHLLVASFNIENADPTDPQAKFDAIAAEIVSNLARPDIIGLQEVQDADGAGAGTNLSGQATADKIIAAIVAAGGPTYRYVEIAPATANSTGGEPGGNIRNGYLYNPDRVGYVAGSAALVGPAATYAGTRSPLAATFTFLGENVTLINAHSTSRGGSDLSFGANQPPNQAGDLARTAQATGIKNYIDGLQAANPDAKVVTLGDFNGYYYETALSQLTNDGKMTNLYTLLSVEERYSYLFDGAVQAFDNIIVTNNMLPGTTFDVVHINAQAVNQPVTDHDQPVARIYFNTAPVDLTLSNASVAENAAAGTLVGIVAGTDTSIDTLTYSLVDSAGGRFAIDATTGRLTTTTPLDFETLPAATVTVRVTDNGGKFYDEAFRIAVTDVNEAPTALTIDTATIAENTAAGTLVGTVTGVDPERGTLRYSLVDSAGGLFAIDATTGRITTTAPIDFETRRSAAIIARATDAGGLTFDQRLTIAVTDVNEAPGRPVLTGTSVTENAPAGTVIGTLSATDPDVGDTVTFTLVTNDARFRIVGNQLLVASGAAIDFETQQTIALSIAAADRAGLTTNATITLTVNDVAETLPGGTAGNDTITGGPGADIINAGDGNDIVNGGLGRDTITLGAGADTVRGLLSEIIGDTITDFTFDDRLIVLRSDLQRSNLTISGTGASTVVSFPGGGTLALPAGLTGGDLMAAHLGNDSIITFNPYLASLSEGGSVAPGAVNGIVNQAYLTGDTSTSFTVSIESLSGARFANSLGVYEIDSVTGAISDVRIIAANVKNAGGSITVTGVEVGHQLGFFLVQDGANKLSSAVLQSTSLSLIAQGGHLVLANNGTAVGGATTFFSHSAAANVDGQAHVLSGVSADGLGAIRIGFEDLARGGSASDNDFQDVVITVAAVPMAHPVSTIGAAGVMFASGDATADVLHHVPANDAIVVHDFLIA